MKYLTTIFFVLILMKATILTAQIKEDSWGVSLMVDPNQMIGIVDNPRTETESFGFDYDLEAWVRYSHFGIYVYYGSFQEINYQNYGAGVDYYVNWFKQSGIDLSLGINNGIIMRMDADGNWGALIAQAARAKTTIWITKNIGGELRLQAQRRPDLPKVKNGTILEGAIGIVIRFHRQPMRNRF